MCGIIGYLGKKNNVLNVLIDGLKSLEYRGYDSAGIAYVYENKIKIIKEVGKIKELEKNIDYKDYANIGIGHTRWATHGGVTKTNSHPHKNGKITLVHNGIIENYEELKEELKKNGYVFVSETDSEVVAAVIDNLYKDTNDLLKAVNKAKDILKGSYALAIISDDEKDTLYATRKDSPLIVAQNENDYFIASDVPAILKYTNKYSLINNNEIIKITENGIKVYDVNLNEIEKEVLTFEGSLESAEKNGFDHFMLKEINEQPEVIKNIIKYFIDEDTNTIKNIPNINKYNKIDIVACGSAYHTGLVGKVLIEEYANIPVSVEIASEYRYKKLFLNENSLVILVSQSGETADTLASLRIAKELKADTLAIVNVVGSSIAREADDVIYIKAGPEIAVATTKAYSAQIMIFALIALYAAYQNNNITKDELLKYIDEIKSIAEHIQTLLSNQEYKKISQLIYNNSSLFFIGRQIDYAIALEGSLKLKEISYIHSETYAAGELKHGTISLIEENTPVITVITDESIAEKTISNIKEVVARGARVIVVTTDKINSMYNLDYEKIVIPTTSKLTQSNLAIIPLQLIAYETAKLKGYDIDKPRNLAKSVTVE